MKSIRVNSCRAAILVLLLFASSAFALTCPAGQAETCLFGVCGCLPEMNGETGIFNKDTVEQTSALVLEQWLTASRDAAIADSQPIPPKIRKALHGYIDEDVMDRVRYKVGDDGALNLAGLIIDYGDKVYGKETVAVTLVDLIVFRNADDALNSPSLWLHELTHVQQYRDLGPHAFALRYVRDPKSIEAPAYAAEAAYGK